MHIVVIYSIIIVASQVQWSSTQCFKWFHMAIHHRVKPGSLDSRFKKQQCWWMLQKGTASSYVIRYIIYPHINIYNIYIYIHINKSINKYTCTHTHTYIYTYIHGVVHKRKASCSQCLAQKLKNDTEDAVGIRWVDYKGWQRPRASLEMVVFVRDRKGVWGQVVSKCLRKNRLIIEIYGFTQI